MHKIVIGLGFGDEGKGMAVAHEVERIKNSDVEPVVVRFNGGPQAGHNVRVKSDGKILHHTHSQFGSGALLGANTVITRDTLFDPLTFVEEAKHLSKVMGRDMTGTVTLDGGCPMVTMLHVYASREIAAKNGHGSTGKGIGVARLCDKAVAKCDVSPEMRLEAGDVLWSSLGKLLDKLIFWREYIDVHFGTSLRERLPDDEVYAWAKRLHHSLDGLNVIGAGDAMGFTKHVMTFREYGIVFEGSQGMLLDQRCGWFPHVTHGDMSAFEARRAFPKAKVIGVTRSYQTRHGAGPMPTEFTCDIPETDNVYNEWAGEFRTGLLDMPNLGRAAAETCVDEVAISNLDRYPGKWVSAWSRTEREGCDRPVPHGATVIEGDEDKFVKAVESVCGAPVTVVGRGPVTDEWYDR